MTSRRTFLQQAAGITSVGLLGGFSGRRIRALTANDVMPPPDDELFRTLALAAVEAARAAGAGFADVRLAGGRQLVLGGHYAHGGGAAMDEPQLTLVVGYGVRAMVDGAWGFAGGYALTLDAVTRVAREAVERARANRPQRPRTLELAPAPKIENERWVTPIERDPFAVSIGEQADLLLAAMGGVADVPGVRGANGVFWWTQAERIFASTEGSIGTQRVTLSSPFVSAYAEGNDPRYRANALVEGIEDGGYGYEAVNRVDLSAALRVAAGEAVEKVKALRPIKSAEVGRYDLVFSGQVMSSLLVRTVSEALNAERALGYMANQQGTSFAAPPAEILGKYRIGSPLLTVRADRSRAHGWSTVGWDDDGIKPDDYVLVRDGIVTDYHTNRQTAAEIGDWYARNGRPVCSHGCASGTGQEMPRVEMPNLTLDPGQDDVSVDDLIADTKRGFYVQSFLRDASDQQVLNTQYGTDFLQVREIRNGQLGDRVDDLGFQFITPQFWKQLDAIGGSSSVSLRAQGTRWAGNAPLQLGSSTVSAVPARVRQVNILNLGRTA